MSIRHIVSLLSLIVVLLGATDARAQTGRAGVRGGVGTDVTLGIAYGAGVNYFVPRGNGGFEPGVILFGGSFSEESTSGIHKYTEDTDVFAFALLANYLVNYAPDRRGLFVVAGFGLGAIMVDWTESSPTDTSLGTPRPGGGSMQSDDGTAGGTIFNFGMGANLASRFDVRFEVPVMVTFSPPGGASAVVPMFMVTGGFRF
jgi:hypothetical protein